MPVDKNFRARFEPRLKESEQFLPKTQMHPNFSYARFTPIAPRRSTSCSRYLRKSYQKNIQGDKSQCMQESKEFPQTKLWVSEKDLKPSISSLRTENDAGSNRKENLLFHSEDQDHSFSSLGSKKGVKVPTKSPIMTETIHKNSNGRVAADVIKIFQLARSRPCTSNTFQDEVTNENQSGTAIIPFSNFTNKTHPNILPNHEVDLFNNQNKEAISIPKDKQNSKAITAARYKNIWPKKSQTLRKLLPTKVVVPPSSTEKQDFARDKSRCLSVLSLTKVLEKSTMLSSDKIGRQSGTLDKPYVEEESKPFEQFDLQAVSKIVVPEEPSAPSPVLKVVLTKRNVVSNTVSTTAITNLSTVPLHYFGTSVKTITNKVGQLVKKQKEKNSMRLPNIITAHKPTKLFLKNV